MSGGRPGRLGRLTAPSRAPSQKKNSNDDAEDKRRVCVARLPRTAATRTPTRAARARGNMLWVFLEEPQRAEQGGERGHHCASNAPQLALRTRKSKCVPLSWTPHGIGLQVSAVGVPIPSPVSWLCRFFTRPLPRKSACRYRDGQSRTLSRTRHTTHMEDHTNKTSTL